MKLVEQSNVQPSHRAISLQLSLTIRQT